MGNFATIADVLEYHCEAGNTKRHLIAKAARVSESTVSRWVHGETAPNFDEAMRLIERLPRIVGDSIRELIPPADEFRSDELDLNRDTRIDLDDAMQGVIDSGRSQQMALSEVIADQSRTLLKIQAIIGRCGLKAAQ